MNTENIKALEEAEAKAWLEYVRQRGENRALSLLESVGDARDRWEAALSKLNAARCVKTFQDEMEKTK